MSTAAMVQLGEVVADVRRRKEVRTTVVRAEGKVFVAGADIKEMMSLDPAGARRFGEAGMQTCDALAALPSVTIAAVHAAALGGGLEIALACDFRIATASAKVGLSESSLGLIPGWGGIRRAAALIGMPAAKRLMFSAEPMTAAQAKDVGLVDEVIADEAAMHDAVTRLRKSLVKGSPAAVARIKRALLDANELGAFEDCFATGQAKEGMAAFVEKRAPDWVRD
jgi:enoyl-CoA hydratase/carnithine racemase